MKEFITIDFDSDRNQDQIIALFRDEFPRFTWRCGDSDMQGLYVSGANSELIKIKVWISDEPRTATLSFQACWPELANREVLKQNIYEQVIQVLTKLGTVHA